MYKNYVVCYDPSPSVLLRILSSGVFIGERSEPPSDKLGGEIFIFSCMLVCLSVYIYIYMMLYGLTTNTIPTHIVVCAHPHLIKG